MKEASQFAGRHSASKGGNFGLLGDDFEDLLARHRLAHPSAAPPSAAQSAVAAAAAAAVVERAAASLDGHMAGETQQGGNILEEAVRSGLAGPATPMAQRVRDLLASQAVAEATWHAVARTGGNPASERASEEPPLPEDEGSSGDSVRVASVAPAMADHSRNALQPATCSSLREGGEGRAPDGVFLEEPEDDAVPLTGAE